MFGLAYTYNELGLLRKAKVLAKEQLSLEQDLQERDIDSIHSVTILLAGLNCELEDWPEAEKYCRQVWKVGNTTLGGDHPDTISSLQCLLDVSMKLESTTPADIDVGPLSKDTWGRTPGFDFSIERLVLRSCPARGLQSCPAGHFFSFGYI